MAITVAVVLEEGAKALAAAYGRELARQVAHYLFGHLATKEDLRHAVEELKSFIDQRIDRLEDDLEAAGLLAAQTHLKDYWLSGDERLLAEANASLVGSVSLFRARSAEDDSFDRTHFVSLLKLVNTDIAIWLSRSTAELNAASTRRIANTAVLKDRCFRHAAWIEETISAISEYQAETISDVRVEVQDETPAYDPPGPRPPKSMTYFAAFDLVGRRYPTGTHTMNTASINNRRAVEETRQRHAEESQRIANEAHMRDTQLVVPSSRYCASLRSLGDSL